MLNNVEPPNNDAHVIIIEEIKNILISINIKKYLYLFINKYVS